MQVACGGGEAMLMSSRAGLCLQRRRNGPEGFPEERIEAPDCSPCDE